MTSTIIENSNTDIPATATAITSLKLNNILHDKLKLLQNIFLDQHF